MKRLRFAAIALLLAALVFGPPPAHSQAPLAASQPYFQIVNKYSGLALDLIGGNTANTAVINQWTPDPNSPNQRWAIVPTEHADHFKLISWVSGKAMSIAGDATTTGAQLWDYTYTGNDRGQQWDLVDQGNGYFKIRNVNSGLVLDDAAYGTANNTKAQQWTDGGTANQLWSLKPWGNYFLRAAGGRYVCVQGSSNQNGAAIILYDWQNNPWFDWTFTSEGGGYCGLFSVNAPTRVLCVNQGSTTAGVGCHLYDYNPNNIGDQKVRVAPKLDGNYKLYFAHDGMSWDIPGGAIADNTPLQQYPDNSNSWQEFMLERDVAAGGLSNPIEIVSADTIPTPSGAGAISLRVLNGTNGAFPDSQVYWGILGQNPANGNHWSYVDVNGNIQPISAALNTASGHLTKNGVSYANIYSTVSQKQWINLPKLSAARMYLSVGSPCYITTYDTGFAGPDINNSADPNANVTFDFIEFTVDSGGYHGNTTRVDMFGFPIQHRVVTLDGSFDQTVGERESESRAGIFSEYQNEENNAFQSLGSVQVPYRIVAPIHGSFASGQPNASYFAGYSSVSTQDILLGTGGAADPGTCAALNRHVYTQPQSTWGNVLSYYNAAPANFYAQFWHSHAINQLAYGFAYDDVNQQAAYISVGGPKALIVRVGW